MLCLNGSGIAEFSLWLQLTDNKLNKIERFMNGGCGKNEERMATEVVMEV